MKKTKIRLGSLLGRAFNKLLPDSQSEDDSISTQSNHRIICDNDAITKLEIQCTIKFRLDNYVLLENIQHILKVF